MLIYVNQFEHTGPEATDEVFHCIAGWLKNVTRRYFTINELKSGQSFIHNIYTVNTFTAVDNKPHMYSILLLHKDRSIQGRTWNTEIGIKIQDNSTILSILMETREASALVNEFPEATSPRLVSYIQRSNSLHPNTVGKEPIYLNNDNYSFEGLASEIEMLGRNSILVLISESTKSENLIDINKLQVNLLGLAKIIFISKNINSTKLERILTRRYTVWDGAVNIIYPSYSGEPCRNTLLQREVLMSWNNSNLSIHSKIISYVTNNTNLRKRRDHFSPTDLRAKRQKDQYLQLQEKIKNLSSQINPDQEQLAQEYLRGVEFFNELIAEYEAKEKSDSNELLNLLETNEELEDINQKLGNDNSSLKLQLERSHSSGKNKNKPLLFFGNKYNYYQNEIPDLILQIIEDHLKNGAVKDNSRRDEVLSDILKTNLSSKFSEEIETSLRSALKGYKGVTPQLRSVLQSANMTIDESGKTHNKIHFLKSTSPFVTCSKTPSDNRAGGEIMQDIKQNLL